MCCALTRCSWVWPPRVHCTPTCLASRSAWAPSGLVLAAVPHAAIGFVEAHGLALIIGVLLWRAVPAPQWHGTAMAVHLLLGGANLAFWPLFGAAGMVGVGVVTTVLHGLFVALQTYALYEAYPARTGADAGRALT